MSQANSKSKVTLVYPSIRWFGGFNKLGKHPSNIYVNHGFTSLSAVLKSRGHTVSMIDLRECSGWDDVFTKMRLSNADVFAVQMSTLDFHEAAKIATFAKKLGVPSVVGGPHASICPEQVAENTDFDFVFVGEGEKTFPEFVEEQKFTNDQKVIKGEPSDLNSLPIEDREIFNMNKVLSTKHTFYPSPFVNVMSGRGCPFSCGFCKPGEDMIFGRFRMRSVENLMKEIIHLRDHYNYKMLMIDDDSFTVNPSYIKDFCDSYEGVKRPFSCQTRADFVVKHPDLVKRLRDVGLWLVVMGIESFNQRLLDFMNKGTTVEQNIEAIQICKKMGIKVGANLMFGLPTETKEETLETINKIKELKPFYHSPSFYTPIQGTHMYDYCQKNKLLLNDDPAFLGSRNATEPKILGLDYKYLNKQLQKLRIESIKWLPLKQRIPKVARWGLRKMWIK
ncbi:MAG: B12-binding domain-containing radical SAM protein [Candidatus Bathyarchaeota archaeon]|nr:B12-binding domain-containing radical SAM protein [Candidatus Bathyarchaeum sp.]